MPYTVKRCTLNGRPLRAQGPKRSYLSHTFGYLFAGYFVCSMAAKTAIELMSVWFEQIVAVAAGEVAIALISQKLVFPSFFRRERGESRGILEGRVGCYPLRAGGKRPLLERGSVYLRNQRIRHHFHPCCVQNAFETLSKAAR